ncbi:MAG: hypothetical protein Q8Q38_01355 [bacterium]|nr:hypothetical protein [bacterium]
MNLEDITKILGKTGKVVIVENGKPSYVVVPFEEYVKAAEVQEDSGDAFPQISEENGNGEEDDGEELTIDDLPV